MYRLQITIITTPSFSAFIGPFMEQALSLGSIYCSYLQAEERET